MPKYRICLANVPRTAKPRLNDFHAQEVNGERLHVYKARTYDEKDLADCIADQRHVAIKLHEMYEYYHGAFLHIEPDLIDWKTVAQEYAHDLTAARQDIEALSPPAPAPAAPAKPLSPPTPVGVDGAPGGEKSPPASVPSPPAKPAPQPPPAAGPPSEKTVGRRRSGAQTSPPAPATPSAPANEPPTPSPVKASGKIIPPATPEKPPTRAQIRAAKKAAKAEAAAKPPATEPPK